ncbi:MAG: AraC family transcriptional regulator [Treponema sp.]|nr:AraC family transcriptional regulator [Treponema sp.]
MIDSPSLLYEQAYAIHINKPSDDLFYYFDYDERHYSINMEFQHFHTFYEIFMLLDTEASHIIDGTYYPLQKYDMVFLRPALLHKSEYPHGKPRKRLVIDFAVPAANPLLKHSMERIFGLFSAPTPIYRFSADKQQLLFDILNDIFNQGKRLDPVRDFSIHTKFMEFLYTVYEQSRFNIYEPGRLPDTPAFRMYTITAWIHRHYAQEMTLETLADRFNISSCYLSHQFRKVTGFSVINYIQMTRIKNVQQLLLYSDKKITTIAEECGFSSFSQFNRTFNTFCHMSPSKYRSSAK